MSEGWAGVAAGVETVTPARRSGLAGTDQDANLQVDLAGAHNETKAIMLAIEMLVRRLVMAGALDGQAYANDLKVAYNRLSESDGVGPSRADTPAGRVLHTLIRHLEFGPSKSRPKP